MSDEPVSLAELVDRQDAEILRLQGVIDRLQRQRDQAEMIVDRQRDVIASLEQRLARHEARWI